MKVTTSLLALFALLGGLAGCRSLPAMHGNDVKTLVQGPLAERSPADIAVLPIENQTGSTSVPLEALRRSFYEGLVKKRYSPLALDYVDRAVVEASYTPGMLDEEAALVCLLTGWDDSAWDTRYRVTVSAEVYLLDATPSVGGRELWGGSLEETISVDADRARFANEDDLRALVARRFVDEVLGALPMRDPVAAAGGR